jgi:hypothetical protein
MYHNVKVVGAQICGDALLIEQIQLGGRRRNNGVTSTEVFRKVPSNKSRPASE